MPMEKGERGILSFFPSSEQAQAAAQAMKDAGLVPEPGSIQVDRISRFGKGDESEYNSPINHAATLSGVTLYSSAVGEDGASPLLAAMNSASGIGNPNSGVAGEHGFMVTLVTAAENVSSALQIIKQNGGET